MMLELLLLSRFQSSLFPRDLKQIDFVILHEIFQINSKISLNRLVIDVDTIQIPLLEQRLKWPVTGSFLVSKDEFGRWTLVQQISNCHKNIFKYCWIVENVWANDEIQIVLIEVMKMGVSKYSPCQTYHIDTLAWLEIVKRATSLNVTQRIRKIQIR